MKPTHRYLLVACLAFIVGTAGLLVAVLAAAGAAAVGCTGWSLAAAGVDSLEVTQ